MPTTWHIFTYLFGVCLFSISFLVFINSTVSFVITDCIGQRDAVGDSVGTLGFADELVAIVACPLWGLLSDRIGLRTVTVLGYVLVAAGLFVFVQAQNVFPQLLLARMFFSLGGSATATMVTAVLPSVTISQENQPTTVTGPRCSQETSSASPEDSIMLRNLSQTSSGKDQTWLLTAMSGSRLAGFVGAFAGCGALVALSCFLPLPSQFQKLHISPKVSLQDAYYVVGTIAVVVALLCFFGLRNLPGEHQKGFHGLWKRDDKVDEQLGLASSKPQLSYWNLFAESIRAAWRYPDICLGYVGGFVARASSVGLSLFVPLFVNNYFITTGLCRFDDETQVRSQCKDAYILVAKLTGISQLVALLLAPAFGYFSDISKIFQVPLLVAAVSGIVGYGFFAFGVETPDPSREGGSNWIYLVVSLLGVAQIGAIVCSLGLLSRTISAPVEPESDSNGVATTSASYGGVEASETEDQNRDEADESHGLLGMQKNGVCDLSSLKGSIAGVYSLAGGAGILLLTKLGGSLFDSQSPSAPFILLLAFYSILFAATVLTGFVKARATTIHAAK